MGTSSPGGCSPLSPAPLRSCTTPECNHNISARFHGSGATGQPWGLPWAELGTFGEPRSPPPVPRAAPQPGSVLAVPTNGPGAERDPGSPSPPRSLAGFPPAGPARVPRGGGGGLARGRSARCWGSRGVPRPRGTGGGPAARSRSAPARAERGPGWRMLRDRPGPVCPRGGEPSRVGNAKCPELPVPDSPRPGSPGGGPVPRGSPCPGTLSGRGRGRGGPGAQAAPVLNPGPVCPRSEGPEPAH
ncbi:collagen, type I, alpha 1a-like [Pseudopipra pipra]|uniref:collagen, type I, alpha 1a-like n=1 Tax=Pseudopipra pipra TaxID=415032 RepID=UPI00313A2927